MQRATRLAVGVLPALGHGSEGTQELIVREVEDPVTGKARDVVGIVRPGGVDHMHARGQLTDRQKDAADRLLQLYEIAHSDGMKGIDYSKLRVDGQSGGDAFGAGDRIVRAIRELERVRAAVRAATKSDEAYGIVLRVVVEGRSLRSIARERIQAAGRGNEAWAAVSLGRQLVKALDAMDALWNTHVGTGTKTRTDAGERTSFEVALSTVRVEATTVDGVKFVQSIARLKDSKAKRSIG